MLSVFNYIFPKVAEMYQQVLLSGFQTLFSTLFSMRSYLGFCLVFDKILLKQRHCFLGCQRQVSKYDFQLNFNEVKFGICSVFFTKFCFVQSLNFLANEKKQESCGQKSNFRQLEIKFNASRNQIKIFSCSSTIQWFEKPMNLLKGLSGTPTETR